MKKLLLALIITLLILIGTNTDKVFAQNMPPKQRPPKEQMRREFEQRLQLTESQKQKAHALHQRGRQQMQPIFCQMELDRQEIENLKYAKMSEKARTAKIAKLNNEIKILEKKADNIRKNDAENFEKLLNPKQKRELDKMKAEGRMQFEKHHPPRPPFQGLGTPAFLLMPNSILPPPPPPMEFRR